jgi:hypothetical protein
VLKNVNNIEYVTINSGDAVRKVVIAGLSDFAIYQWYYYVRNTDNTSATNGQSIVVKDDVVYVTFQFTGTIEIRTVDTQWATLPSSDSASIGLVRISAKTGQFIDAKELVSGLDVDHTLLSSNFSSITPIDGKLKHYLTCSVSTNDPPSQLNFYGLDVPPTPTQIEPPYFGTSTYTVMYDGETGSLVGVNYTGGPNTTNISVALSNCIDVSSNNTVVVGGAYVSEVYNDPPAYISTFANTNDPVYTLTQTGQNKNPLFTVYLIPTCLGTLGNPSSANVTKTILATNTNGNVFEVDTASSVSKNNVVSNNIIIPKTGSSISMFWNGTNWYVLSSVDSSLL